ncbi:MULTISPECIES: CHAT domain-containing protein [unclassified Coleofasciculus]|uniref:CHAT domain-containing protein n=1 Tax=unclassified Coleofasciculus TaxID=2692782 RepID=UPI00187FE6E6|nr:MULTISPECIES: CHAT domain-containing protein [unclassified Coleofasciculus]MBE9124809.1 CHAT domain-containing protein [Coleofasciculus sp. LEGE 07081]MBE9147714.1 CHAT domain-containing protein [Coleofasciculus sp. LEGE 07092]
MVAPISIVITTYNRERYLGAAIESVLWQTMGDFELLVWDDGSTDGSVEIIHEYAKRDRRVRVVAAEHQGRVLALKAAITQTTGTYIGWVDSDDILAPAALQETAAVLDAQTAVGMVYTDYLTMEESGKVRGYGNRCHIPYSKDRLLLDFMTFHFRLIRRSVYNQVGGINESFHYVEDYDLCLRLSEMTEVRHIQKPLYYYRNHSDNICHQHQAEQILQAHKAVARAIARRSLVNRSGTTSKPLQPSLIRVAASGILSLAALPLMATFAINPAQAQITSAGDSANTIVSPHGDRIDITGGQMSGDGANLFQSFNQFGLNENQIANFISQPSIQNILGRVIGGDPSIINGLIQVSGGNSNLFLMNPSGIIFGSQASLNVPANFTVTTATGIGFEGGWFSAVGSNEYTNLIGNPNAFQFDILQPGAIINAANLAVPAGHNLSLLGGEVINTGTIQSVGGTITLAAVPGTSRVNLSQQGHILTLELQPSNNQSFITPLMLPELLTGSNVETGLVNNNNAVQTAAGTVIPTQTGTAIVSGTLDAAASPNGQGGNVDVFGSQVGFVDQAQVNVSGDTGGGTVRIGGEYMGQGTVPNAQMTVVDSDVVIDADAEVNGNGGRVIVWSDDFTRFWGTITARGGTQAGDGGFVETSGENLLEAIGGSVDASATNGLPGLWLLDPRNVTITTAATSGSPFTGGIFTPPVDDAIISVDEILAALDAGTSVTITTGTTGTQDGNITVAAAIDGLTLSPDNVTLTLSAANDIFVNAPITNASTIHVLNLEFLAGGNIDVNADITTAGGSINFMSSSGLIDTAGGTLNSSSTFTDGGAITLEALVSITTGDINSSSTVFSGTDRGGAVTLMSDGDITTGEINSSYNARNPYGSEGGAVSVISSGGSIETGEINSSSTNDSTFGIGGANSQGGSVELDAAGSITTDGINSSGSSNGDLDSIGSSVIIKARNDINVSNTINSSASSSDFAFEGSSASGSATGGQVQLNSTAGGITTQEINSSAFSSAFSSGGSTSSDSATSGLVNLTSQNTITTTGEINSSAFSSASDSTGTATANSVTLEGSSIIFDSIDTSAFSELADGRGGDVSITANGIPDGVIQGVGTLTETSITILTEGNTQSGTVGITHNGGIDNELFTVGDASINGTVGAINAGESNTIEPTQQFPDSGTEIPDDITSAQGNISITFINQSPTLTAESLVLPTLEVNESITFKLSDLGLDIEDLNGDNTTLQITDITSGTLTLEDGTPVTSETELSIDDILVYTPPTDETGELPAFTIISSDRVSVSEELKVSVNIAELPEEMPPEEMPPEEIPSEEIPDDDGTPLNCTTDNQPPLACTVLPEEKPIEALPVPETLSPSTPIKTESEAREILAEIERATGAKPALIYVTFVPTEISINSGFTGFETSNTEAFDDYLNRSQPNITIEPQDSDQLELLILTSKSPPIRKRIAGVTRGQVLREAETFRRNITSVQIPRDYRTPGRQLYQWILAPLEEYLQAQEIDNLTFIMDAGLRSLPMAALHDGNGFIVERYSVGFMPSLSLTDTRYVDIRDVQILAMGASTFTELNPLPAVPLELGAIAGPLWQGKAFLNEEFTLENIQKVRSSQPFGIVHLATHGEFKPGNPSNSFIQLWNKKLGLDQLRQLGLNNPPTELLVLSACRTALGDREAELGFAGLAIEAGVKSALGSLWYVSDAGTLGFMTSFYEQLKKAPIKAEALRQAQLAMLKGEVRLEGGELVAGDLRVPLTPELAQLGDKDFTHPYYWSALTLVGSPW